jgi:uncharacterized membrane protein YhaH (DUF805 family)
MSLFQTLFGLDGRVARLPYFCWGLLASILSVVGIFAAVYGFSPDGRGTMFGGLVLLAGVIGSIWMGVALTVKRLHDIGHDGLHAAWIFVLGVIGAVVGEFSVEVALICALASLGGGVWLMFAAGEPRGNRYGPAPGPHVAHATARAVAA